MEIAVRKRQRKTDLVLQVALSASELKDHKTFCTGLPVL